MSSWLIIIIGVIYAAIALCEMQRGNTAAAIVYGSYAVSNIGLWRMAA